MKQIKIKFITVLILLLVVGVGILIGYSYSLFEDVETLEPTVTMAALKLKVGDPGPANIPLNFEYMLPGELRKVPFEMNNIGSIDGNFWAKVEILESGRPGEKIDSPLLDCGRLSLVWVKPDGQPHMVINHWVLRTIERNFETSFGTIVDDAINNGPASMEIWMSTLDCGNDAMGEYAKGRLSLYLTQLTE